jgi:hypothetical protein
MNNRYPRESVELVPLTVTEDGVPTLTYTTALVVDGTRPTTWTPPVTVDADTGVMIGAVSTVGQWRIFVKVSDSPEVPVVDLGTITRT